MQFIKQSLFLIILSFHSALYAFRVYPTTAQDERMLDKTNFPFIAANADGFNLQHDCFAPFSKTQVATIFQQFTNKNLINHGVYQGTNIYTMSTMNKLPSFANVTAFMLYNEAPAMNEAEWDDALSQKVTWPLITHCRAYNESNSFDKLRAEILKTSGIMMEFRVSDEEKYDDAASLMKYCVDNNRMIVFLTTFQETPNIFISAYKEFYYYLKKHLGAPYLNSDLVIFVPNTYNDEQVFPEMLGYGSTFGVAHWLIDQKSKTSDAYIQPTIKITSPQHRDYFENNKNLSVHAAVSDVNPTSVKLFLNNEPVGEKHTAPYSWSGGLLSCLTNGYHELRVDVADNKSNVTSKAIRIKILKEAPVIPGFFQADNLIDYKLRNAPHEDGYVRHVYGEEWIDYKVNVEHTGIYDIDIGLKVQRSKQFGGSITLKKGTQNLGTYTTVLNDPAKTPLDNFTENPNAQIKGVHLTAGQQTLRACFSRPEGGVKPQFYLYDFNFKLRGAPHISFSYPRIKEGGRYPDYNAPASIDVRANVLSPRDEGKIKSVKLYLNDTLVEELSQAPFAWEAETNKILADIPPGEYCCKIVAVDEKNYTSFEQIDLKVIERQPFRDDLKLPGIIDAYQFDIGGEGIAYHDFNEGIERGLGGDENPRYAKSGAEDVEVESYGGKYTVTAVRNGEWLNYTIANIKKASYDVSIMSSANANKSADVKVWLNNDLLTTVHTQTTANTGFATFKNFTTKGVVIPKDMTNATIRLEFLNPNISNYLCFFRQFEFKATGSPPAGISDMAASGGECFSLYPNPTSAQITIDLQQITQADIQIHEINGRCVYSRTNVSGLHIIHRHSLTPGMYIVKIRTNQKKTYYKKLSVKDW